MQDKKANKYPGLQQKFSTENFPVIIAAIEQHFSDLFNLSVLNEIATTTSEAELKTNVYYQLFAFCMQQINSQAYTVNEIVEDLTVIFNKPIYPYGFRQLLFDSLVFVTDKSGLKGKQLGYLERLAAGTAKPAEALSFIDMLRFIEIFCDPKPTVFNLTNLLVCRNLQAIFPAGSNIILNLNRDSRGEPKWAAVHVEEDGVSVYCEAMLLETEKKQLEQLIKASRPEGKAPVVSYEGQTADGGVSSGYLALAWLKEKIGLPVYGKKFGGGEAAADRLSFASNFWSMREVFVYAMAHWVGNVDDRRNSYRNPNLSPYHHKNYALSWDVSVKPSAEIIGNIKLQKNTFYMALADDESLLYRIEGQNCEKITKEELERQLGQHYHEFNNALKRKNSKKLKPLLPHILEITAARGYTPAVNNLGFFLKNQLVQVSDISILYQHDLLKTGKDLFLPLNLTSEGREDEAVFAKQDEALSLSQVDVLAKNRESLQKTDHLTLVGNKLHFKLVENLAEFGYRFPYGNGPNAFFLAVFNDAAARCSDFTILAYPEFQLTEIECQYIQGEMEYNAFIQNLVVEGKNQSLTNLQAELTPFLARNRWLAFNHYKPPVMGDHWQAAARAWLKYLYQHPNVLSDHENYRLFKNAATEMGEMGLAKLLNYLGSHQSAIEALLGEIKPSFYLGVGDKSNCEQLISYLSRPNAYFPFSQMGIGYNQNAVDDLITLLNQLNQREQFSQIQLIDVPSDNQQTTEVLTRLAQQALEQKWTTPIVIKNLSKTLAYHHLNNIILCNRREKLGQAQVKAIEEVSKPEVISVPKAFSAEVALSQADFKIDLGEDEGPWPLSREGTAVQLQLQYQRQLQQQRQLEQKYQSTEPTLVRERALHGKLVSYENINELLKPYYQSLQREFSHLENVNLNLQEFFAAVISANPNVKNAPHAIRYMTQDAAEHLLRQYVAPKPPAPLGGRLCFGLNTDTNGLPKGLFTHRNKDDDLVLCYDSELDQAQQSMPLTLDLDFIPPTATVWQGDFRQFNLEHYLKLKEVAEITDQDLHYMAAFAALQPVEDHKAAILEFGKQHGQLSQEDLIKIAENWLVFTQAWRYAGLESAVDVLKNKIPAIDPKEALILLLPDEDSKQQFKDLDLDDSESRALGQLFYRFGKTSLSLLIKELHAIAKIFPANQFSQFKRAFLEPCQDMCVLFSPVAMQTLRALRSELINQDNPILPLIWWQLSELHAKAVGFERPEKLWQGFQYFVTELRKEGVELNNLAAFQQLKPTNMIVWMDRVLTCIRQVPVPDQKQSLLDQINLYDLSHGGLPYALSEGFKRFDQLKLTQFEQGKPTYAPSLQSIFSWPKNDIALQVKRLLATQSDLSDKSYKELCDYFVHPDTRKARSQLVCLLLIQHSEDQNTVLNALKKLSQKSPETIKSIARCLQKSIYQNQRSKPLINLTALVEISEKQPELLAEWQNIPGHLQIVWLETATTLQQRNALGELKTLTEAMQKPYKYPQNYPLHLQESIYKLMALFGQPLEPQLELFVQSTTNMKLIVRQTVDLLIEQLFSIDWQATSSQLGAEKLWWSLSYAVNFIKGGYRLNDFDNERIKYIEGLTAQGIVFKQSITGKASALTPQNRAELDLSLFTDHELRLWKFLQAHIAIPIDKNDKNAAKSLRPLLNLLKRLQLKRGEVNEIEQLLLALEHVIPAKTDKPVYWHVDYFCQLLQALQPDNDRAPYPISLFKSLLANPFLAAKPINQLPNELPKSLSNMLKMIAQAKEFTRAEQQQLGQLALREFAEKKNFSLTQIVIDQLSKDNYKGLRTQVLQYLMDCNDTIQAEKLWEACEKLLTLNPENQAISSEWSMVCKYWLKAINGSPVEQALFRPIIEIANETKKIQLLHIVAFSTLRQGLKTEEVQQDELIRKAPKLIQQLQQLDLEQLQQLADYYPTAPAPTAEDLLRIIKIAKFPQGSIRSELDAFERNSHTVLPTDYGNVAITRQADFERLLKEMRIEEPGKPPRPLTEEEEEELKTRFDLLKQLEAGTLKVELGDSGEKIAIPDMTRKQLIAKLHSLSNKDLAREEIMVRWALRFRALGHVTREYPHLAQQLSSIVADILPKSATKIAVLETGEGKSHFHALRALEYLAKGKKLHIHTAKRSLAERDQNIYKALFAYLDIPSAYLTSDSKSNILEKYQVIYTTPSDFSHFLDNQAYAGRPIKIDPNWIGLFDEVDFIRFDEGLSTEYNFSIPDSKTPEQMRWFYRVLNEFFDKNKEIFDNEKGIYVKDLRALVDDLVTAAGQNTSKQKYIADLVKEPLQLVRWIQASYARTTREADRHFYPSSQGKIIHQEPYLLREIVPISFGSNQPAKGSTFVGGEQQLVAENLNVEAMHQNQPQNFYSPPLSHVLSSQVADVCISRWYQTWEGATGSLSSHQANILQTTVLRMPTNQPSLRKWEEIQFVENDEDHLKIVTECAQSCLQQQQSILFACENDLSVKTLHTQLATRLTDKYPNQLICLTNDSEESSETVLARKKLLEGWNQDKKQQGIGLVASGLGRGDNPEVEAVVIPDLPRDENDLIQKGGRAARGGAAGTVYQIYRWSQVKETYEELTGKPLEEKFSDLSQAQRVDIFNEVLRLREQNTFLNNQAVQGYRVAKAEYSHWALSILGMLPKESEEETTFETQSISALNKIDKAWLTISANRTLNAEQKIADIRIKINQVANQLYKDCENIFAKAASRVNPFEFSKYRPHHAPIVTNRRKVPAVSVGPAAKETLAKVIAYYIHETDRQLAFDLLEQVIKQISNATILKWLGQWEKLARSLPEEKKSAFLMATLQVMTQCKTQESIAAFEQLFNKTLAWWNKGGNKAYQQSLLTLWHGLAKQSQSENAKSLVDIITTFNLQQPGKLGFTWLSLFTDLSAEVLAKHWSFIQSIIPYLEKLPGKKSNKTLLISKIINVIQKNSQQLFSLTQIQQVIQEFLPDNALFLMRHEGMDRIIHSQLLLLPRRLSPAAKISPENLIVLDGTIIKFLKESKWTAQQIDIYLAIIDQLLDKSSEPLKLVVGLLHFQQQCCPNQFDETVKYFTLLIGHSDVLHQFFVCDPKLNQRFVEFFNFIEDFKLKDHAHLIVFANLYLNIKLSYPRQLAEIYLTCIDKKPKFNLYNDILGLNNFLENQLIAIKNTCRQIDVQYLEWLFLDLKKLTSRHSIDETKGYLEQLSLFYPIFAQLPVDEQGSARLSFATLDFAQARELLTLVISKQDKPYLIPYLLSFFPENGKGELTINPNNSTPLANIFLLYEDKKSQVQKEFRIGNNQVNFVKRLNPFSAKQLEVICTELSNKNVAQIEFILPALVNVVRSGKELKNAQDAIASIDHVDVKKYIQILTQCHHLLGSLEDEQKKAGITSCLLLQGEKLIAFLDFFSVNKNYQIFANHPQAIAHVAKIFTAAEFSIKFANRFAEIFLLAANCLSQKDETTKLTNLFNLLLRLNNTQLNSDPKKILPLLEFIRKYPRNAVQIISDQFFNGYQLLEEQRKNVHSLVSDQFYRLVRSVKNSDPHTLANRNEITGWFDFGQRKTKAKRIAWMQLLLQRAFISLDTSLNPWTVEKNTILLKQGFNAYVQQAAKILSRFGKELKDLEMTQQADLLVLSAELEEAYAGTPTLKNIATAGEELVAPQPAYVEVDQLTQEIGTLIANYTREDKSTERVGQLGNFQAEFNPLVTGRQINYQEALKSIAKARKIAVDSDRDLNAGNWFFMLNRKGHSNYLNMLTHLEHIILQGWATSPHAIISFHHYSDQFSRNLLAAVDAFHLTASDSKVFNKSSLSIDNPRSYTLALVQLNRQLASENFPGHLRTLAKPLAEEIGVWLSYGDRTQNTEEVRLAKLLFEIHQVLDSYAAIGGKSSDRGDDFDKLKTALSDAMKADDCYEALKQAIIAQRAKAVSSDTQHSQDFFPRHYGGDSRYMNVLHQLSDLVIKYAETTQGQGPRWIKNYRQDEHVAAKTNLANQLQTFYQEKQKSPFWGDDDLNEIKKLLNELSPASGKKVANVQLLEGEDEDEEILLSAKDDGKSELIEQAEKTLQLLPGYLQVLAREVIETGKQVELADKLDDAVDDEKEEGLLL